MMQIHPDEITTTKKTPLQLFYEGIRSDATKRDFETKLKKVTCDFLALVLKGDLEKVLKQKTEPKPRKRGIKRQFSDADFEDRVNELVILTREDPEKVEKNINLEQVVPIDRGFWVCSHCRPAQKFTDRSAYIAHHLSHG